MLKTMLIRYFGQGLRRKQAWYRHLRRIAKKNGFHVYERNMVWKDQPLFRAGLEKGARIEGIPQPRLFVLQSVIQALVNTPGDVAECGVRNARSTLFLLTADRADRRYCLFDSWEGVSDPTEADQLSDGSIGWAKGDLETDESNARTNLSQFKNVEYFKGWIPTRFDEVGERKFALLHVDVDLYDPTRDALEFFGARLCDGGIMICDDYGSDACPGARRACDEYARDHGFRLIELPTGQCLMMRDVKTN